jgi:TM2 domain-containing membrane protein YozV
MDTPATAKKSYWIAYLLYFTFGWVGAHRFYLGRWTTGFLYLLILSLWGVAVILPMLVDFFLLFFLVRKVRKQTVEDPLKLTLNILFAKQEREKVLAPWAREPTFLSQTVNFFDNLLRFGLFFIGPLVVMMFSLYVSGSLETLILTVFILLLAGYIGPMDQVISSMQKACAQSTSLAKMPFLADVIETVRAFYDYYYQQKPGNVMYYLLYPITGLMAFFSPAARQEFKLYKNIFILVVVTLLVESLFSYGDIYPPYLTVGNAIFITILIIVFGLITLVTALMPTITTCFKFRFSGKRLSLAVITTLTLLFNAFIYTEFNKGEMMPLVASETIKLKMQTEVFRADLSQLTEMFLSYVYQKLPAKLETKAVSIHAELTQHYQRQLKGIATADEVKAFKVLMIPSETGWWLGVHYNRLQFDQIEEPVLLFMLDPNGKFYQQWKALPASIREQFTITYKAKVDQKNYQYNQLSWPLLINEFGTNFSSPNSATNSTK